MQRTTDGCNVQLWEARVNAMSAAWEDAEKRDADEQPQAPALEAGEAPMYRAFKQLEAWCADGIITFDELTECINRLWLT